MTPEELLKPRYKVIAEDTSGDWNLNSILEFNPDWQNRPVHTLYDDEGSRSFSPAYFDQFPHLFAPLPWYADRKPEDMPEYLKVNVDNTALFNGDYHKVHVWKINAAGHFYCLLEVDRQKSLADMFRYFPEHFIPATKEEYDNYMNQNTESK